MKNQNLKDKIINYLKKHKGQWLSTRNIAVSTNTHWYKTELILSELLKETKIKCDNTKTKITYWMFGENEKEENY